METTQHNNETQITERRFILTPRDKELPIEGQVQKLFTYFGNEIDKAKAEYDIHLDSKKTTLATKTKDFVNGNSSTGVLGALLLILLSSSLSAKDLCSKKGPDELLKSSTYSGKFFFKYDCKKRKTYFSKEQARIVNDKLKIEREREITFKVKLDQDDYLVILANQNGVIQTGHHDGILTIWNKEDQRRISKKRKDDLSWKY